MRFFRAAGPSSLARAVQIGLANVEDTPIRGGSVGRRPSSLFTRSGAFANADEEQLARANRIFLPQSPGEELAEH